jgi:hypothetical protein
LVRAGGDGRASGSLGGGLVLRRNAGGDAAAGADRDALVFLPGPGCRRCADGLMRSGPAGGAALARPYGRARRTARVASGTAWAFFLFRPISHSAPPIANRIVPSAGPPSRSSSSATSMTAAAVSAPYRSTVMPRSPHRRQLPGPPFLKAPAPEPAGGPPPAPHTASSAASPRARTGCRLARQVRPAVLPPYAPQAGGPWHVVPGSSLKRHCPPEPCAQVRILLGRLNRTKILNARTSAYLADLHLRNQAANFTPMRPPPATGLNAAAGQSTAKATARGTVPPAGIAAQLPATGNWPRPPHTEPNHRAPDEPQAQSDSGVAAKMRPACPAA